MEKRKKVIAGLWVILLLISLTGCRSSFGNTSAKTASGECAVVVLESDGVTIKNITTDVDDYAVFSSDISSWQVISSLPQEAEELYTFISYEKVNDLSLINNSGKFWLVSVQETLYRVEDTYYLKLGMISDGKDGIVINTNTYYQLPDSIGERYVNMAENNAEFLGGDSSSPSWPIENYAEWLDEYFEGHEEAVEGYFDYYADRLDDKMDDFDEYFEETTIPWIEAEFDRDWDLVMENRIERWVDHSFDRMGGIIEVGVGVLIRAILGILFLPFIVLYILGSVGLYRMAKKLGYGSPWLAWIPIAKLYLMFTLPGKPFRVLAVNKVIEKRENAFWIFLAAAMAKRILQGMLDFPGGRVFFLFEDAVSIVWLVFLIFFLYPLYKDLFALFESEQKATVFAVLSLILPILLPIFLLAASSKAPKSTGGFPPDSAPEGISGSINSQQACSI